MYGWCLIAVSEAAIDVVTKPSVVATGMFTDWIASFSSILRCSFLKRDSFPDDHGEKNKLCEEARRTRQTRSQDPAGSVLYLISFMFATIFFIVYNYVLYIVRCRRPHETWKRASGPDAGGAGKTLPVEAHTHRDTDSNSCARSQMKGE